MDVHQSGKARALRQLRSQQETPKTLIQRWTQEIQNESQPQFCSPDAIFSQEQEAQRHNNKQRTKTPKLDATIQTAVTTFREVEDSFNVSDLAPKQSSLRNKILRRGRRLTRAVDVRKLPEEEHSSLNIQDSSDIGDLTDLEKDGVDLPERKINKNLRRVLRNKIPVTSDSMDISGESLDLLRKNKLKRRAPSVPQPNKMIQAKRVILGETINRPVHDEDSLDLQIDVSGESLDALQNNKLKRRAPFSSQPISTETNDSSKILGSEINASNSKSLSRRVSRHEAMTRAEERSLLHQMETSGEPLNISENQRLNRTPLSIPQPIPAATDNLSEVMDSGINASNSISQSRRVSRHETLTRVEERSLLRQMETPGEPLKMSNSKRLSRTPLSLPQPVSTSIKDSSEVLGSGNKAIKNISLTRRVSRHESITRPEERSLVQQTETSGELVHVSKNTRLSRSPLSKPQAISAAINNSSKVLESGNNTSQSRRISRHETMTRPVEKSIRLLMETSRESPHVSKNKRLSRTPLSKPQAKSAAINDSSEVMQSGNKASNNTSQSRRISRHETITRPEEQQSLEHRLETSGGPLHVSKNKTLSKTPLSIPQAISAPILDSSEVLESGKKVDHNTSRSRRVLRSESMVQPLDNEESLHLRMQIASPIGTSKLLKHLVFTPKHTRKIDASVNRSDSFDSSEIIPEIEAILLDDHADVFGDGGLEKKAPKKSIPRKKIKGPPRETLFFKQDAIFEFERFSGLKLSRQAVPFLMEALEKFNRVSLNRLQNILISSGRRKAGLVDIKQLLREGGLFSKYNGKLADQLFLMDLTKVIPWEIRSKVVPGLGNDVAENVWDDPPEE